MTKVCNMCKVEKPWGEYYINKKGKPIAYCRPCNTKYRSEWTKQKYNSDPAYREYRNNLKRKWSKKTYNKERQYAYSIKRLYNITLEEYNHLLEQQNGVCAICENSCDAKKYLAVDHNHETGKIRGLLCCSCNRALGLFKDSKKYVEKAARYLEEND